MEALSFWACVRGAWLEGGRFVQRRPFTVVVAFAALLACNATSVALSHVHSSASPISALHLTQRVVTLVRLVVMIVLPVQVMQNVILGARESSFGSVFGKEFWRYLRLAAVIGMLCLVIVALVIGGGFLLSFF
jgi:hypothetical protein